MTKNERFEALPRKYQTLARKIARFHDVRVEALFSDGRGKPAEARARGTFMWALHEFHQENFTAIGRYMNRYRKTVSWAHEQGQKRIGEMPYTEYVKLMVAFK